MQRLQFFNAKLPLQLVGQNQTATSELLAANAMCEQTSLSEGILLKTKLLHNRLQGIIL